MKTKNWILLLTVFTFTNLVHCQENAILSNEQQKWLSKARQYEENGWIYLHIQGIPRARGFQYGYLLSNEIKESIRVVTEVWKYRSAMEWEWLVNKAEKILASKVDSENIAELDVRIFYRRMVQNNERKKQWRIR